MRLLPLILAALVSTPVCAQVFPKTDSDKVGEAIERAKKGEQPVKPDEPPVKPDEPPKAVDGAAALKKFTDLRETLHKQENAESRESAKVLDQYQDAVAPYLSALASLKAGYYKEAAKAFKKLAPFSDDEMKGFKGEVRERALELQAGRHYYYRMIAEVLAKYEYKADDGDFDRMWNSAEKAGQTVMKELQQAIARKQIDETRGGITLRRLENWLNDEKGQWAKLRSAEKGIIDRPGELSSWTNYLSMISAREREDMTPDMLSARAVLLMLKEFWAADNLVKRGNVDVGLAWVYTAMYQFERASAALEPHDGLDEQGKRFVDDQKKRILEAQNAANREYKK